MQLYFNRSINLAYAYKMYADDKVEKIQIERRVYDILGDSPYFSTCYGSTMMITLF